MHIHPDKPLDFREIINSDPSKQKDPSHHSEPNSDPSEPSEILPCDASTVNNSKEVPPHKSVPMDVNLLFNGDNSDLNDSLDHPTMQMNESDSTTQNGLVGPESKSLGDSETGSECGLRKAATTTATATSFPVLKPNYSTIF